MPREMIREQSIASMSVGMEVGMAFQTNEAE